MDKRTLVDRDPGTAATDPDLILPSLNMHILQGDIVFAVKIDRRPRRRGPHGHARRVLLIAKPQVRGAIEEPVERVNAVPEQDRDTLVGGLRFVGPTVERLLPRAHAAILPVHLAVTNAPD